MIRYTCFHQWLLRCLYLGMAGVVLGGCSKLIEIQPPINSITSETAFSSDALAESAVAGVYSLLANGNATTTAGVPTFSNSDMTLYAGLAADELSSTFGTLDQQAYPYYSNKVKLNDQVSNNSFWTPIYKIVYQSNAIIEGLAAAHTTLLHDSVRNELAGEAKFLRAFCYFYLTNLYGDVPLPVSTDFNVTALLPRAPQAEVYNQMVTDLQDAMAALPADYSVGRGERIRANKYAAAALLARVYLYQQKWSDAAAMADLVINSNLYALPTDLKSVFLKNSTEAIFQLKQDPSLTIPGIFTYDSRHFMPTSRLLDIPAADLPIYLDSATFTIMSSFVLPLYTLAPTMSGATFEPGDQRVKLWMDSCYTPVTAPYFGKTIYYPIKYPQMLSTAGSEQSYYYMVLRLGEQFLIKAEASAHLQDMAGAQAALNRVRARAGLPPTTAATPDALVTAVLAERRAELFAEWGHRWLDLKRTGKATGVLGAIPDKQPWADEQLLWPLPSVELVNDPNLHQNPGYF